MLVVRIILNKRITRYSSYFAPENIFKEENITRTLANFNKIKPFKVTTNTPVTKAAVLIPLCIVDGKTSLLYTLRTAHLPSHKGQVSFPGGKQDKHDESLEHTAIRETKEELGIYPEHIKIWGKSHTIVNRDTYVLPVIGEVTKELDIKQLNINTDEVQEVFIVSLEDLCNQSKQGYTQFKNTFSTPIFLGGQRRIWGLTAIITHIFLKALLPSNVYCHRIKFIQSFKVCDKEPKK